MPVLQLSGFTLALTIRHQAWSLPGSPAAGTLPLRSAGEPARTPWPEGPGCVSLSKEKMY
jgi:hypothetical protein